MNLKRVQVKDARHYTARLLAKDVIVVSPRDTVANAVARMAQGQVGAVVVLDAERRLVGIFTERDLAFRVVAKGLNPAQVLVCEAMTAKPKTIQAGEALGGVFQVLGAGVHRHLPILEGSELVGMASLHDFVSLLLHLQFDDDMVQRFAQNAINSPRNVIRVRKS